MCNMASNLFFDSLVNQQQFLSQLSPCQRTFCFSCHSLPTSQQIRSGLTTHLQRRHSKLVYYIITLLLYTQSLTCLQGATSRYRYCCYCSLQAHPSFGGGILLFYECYHLEKHPEHSHCPPYTRDIGSQQVSPYCPLGGGYE